MNPLNPNADDRGLRAKEELAGKGASGLFLEHVADTWGVCSPGAGCIKAAANHLEQLASELKASVPTARSIGSLDAHQALFSLTTQLSAEGITPMRQVLMGMCATCFSQGPNGEGLKELAGRTLEALLHSAEGAKLHLLPLRANDGLAFLRVAVVSANEEVFSSFDYHVDEASIRATQQLLDPQKVFKLVTLASVRSLGWIGGPTAALPIGLLSIKRGDSLGDWNILGNQFLENLTKAGFVA